MASDKKKGKTLRSDVLDGRTVRYTIRFTEAENHRMLDMYERSGCHSIAKFLRFRVFGWEFKVVTIDKSRQDYFIKLSSLYRHFSALANNYNQTVKRIHRITDEKGAYRLLKELQRLTAEMSEVMKQIVALTEDYKQTWEAK